MTIEKVVISQDHIQLAFTSSQRPYLECLANRCNYLLSLILENKNTKEEKLEYHSLKWALKELGALEKDDLQKIKRVKL